MALVLLERHYHVLALASAASSTASDLEATVAGVDRWRVREVLIDINGVTVNKILPLLQPFQFIRHVLFQ